MPTQEANEPCQQSGEARKDGDDLSSILTKMQREDLILLITNITRAMRQLLENNFDPAAGLEQGLITQTKGKTEEEKITNAKIDPASADVEAYDREKKLLEQYEKDVASPKTQILKKYALQAFDKWRETVNRRIREVVNSKETALQQSTKTSKPTIALPKTPQTSGEIAKSNPPYGSIKFRDLYPPTKNPLTKLDMDKRTLILHSILLMLLSLEHYNAASRILLLNLTSSLKLPLRTFEQDEYATAKGLLEAAKEPSASEETKKRIEENEESRKWKVGLATIAGAAVIGVTGGFAAPLVAAGVGSVMGGLGLGTTAAAGYLGSVAGSTVLVGSLFGAYGGRMTGRMMDNYARQVEDFAFVPVHSRNKTSEDDKEGPQQASDHDHKLRVIICISGWLTEKDEVTRPWHVLGRGAEVFALKWELEALLNLGNAMSGIVQSTAWGYAQKQLVAQTIFADLAPALWPIGLLKAARVIDNPFSVAKSRADKAGKVLADALANRAQGERPVTLIGYSLGARVIYSCLLTLAKRRAFGLIENAVLIGALTPSDTSDWREMRAVVSGRLVNVFSENDYVLGFMYRTSSIQYGVAGLQKIRGLPGVENVNASEEVSGHTRYRFLIGSILKKLGFEDIDMQAVEEERAALKKIEEEEKKQSLQAQRKRLLRQPAGVNEDKATEAEEEAKEMEKEIKAKTQKSLTTRAVEWWYTPHVLSTKATERAADNVQEAISDPRGAANTVSDTVKDVQEATDSYAARKLPSMPYLEARKTTKAAPAAAKGADATKVTTTQSYSQKAARYLPSFSSLPTPAGLPSIGKSTALSGDATRKAADASNNATDLVIKTATEATKKTWNAEQSTKSNAKLPPIIHQATDERTDVNKATDTTKTWQ